MTILVTGGAGFIGSHFCEAMLARGERVVCLDNFDGFYDPAAKVSNTALLRHYAGFTLVPGDIRDVDLVEKTFAEHRPEIVVHLAAKAGVRPSLQEPYAYTDVNLTGTTRLLEAARRHGTRRFLLASSSSVYGNQQKTPFSETDDVGFPISPYAASKRGAELLCHAWHHLYGVEVACLRFFTVYGPRQRPDLAIHKFTHLALAGQPIPMYGDGKTRRDYTFVSDIVAGLTALVHHPDLGFEIFNLGNGQPVTLLDLVDALSQALGRPLDLHFLEKQPGDVEQTHADISKAKDLLGYAPAVGLREGVGKFVDWYRENGA